MGDWFQIIVDEQAGEEEAPALASSISEWLISEGIIEGTPTDCVLGADEGYPPGPNYKTVADPGPEGDYLSEMWTNGLEIVVGRTVFHTTAGDLFLVCADCGERFELPEEWGDAVSEWYDSQGPGMLSCPQCNSSRPVTEWQHDPPWGFGNLGFQFWNWPPLEASFIEEVSRRLGHKVVLVEGKL